MKKFVIVIISMLLVGCSTSPIKENQETAIPEKTQEVGYDYEFREIASTREIMENLKEQEYCYLLSIQDDELLFYTFDEREKKTNNVYAVNLETEELRTLEYLEGIEVKLTDYVKVGEVELFSYIDYRTDEYLGTGIIQIEDSELNVIVEGKTDYQVQTITFTKMNEQVYFFLYDVFLNDQGTLMNSSSLVYYEDHELHTVDKYIIPFANRPNGPVIMARQGYIYFEPLKAGNHVAYTVYDDNGSLFVLANDKEVIKKELDLHWGLIGTLDDYIIFLEKMSDTEFIRKKYNITTSEVSDFNGMRYSYSNFTQISDNQYFYLWNDYAQLMTYADDKEVKNKLIVPEGAQTSPIHAEASEDFKKVVIYAHNPMLLVGERIEREEVK